MRTSFSSSKRFARTCVERFFSLSGRRPAPVRKEYHARPDKAAAVEELKQQFENSDAVLLTEYRGLTVAQMKELRVSLGENVSYAVVKNTLTKIAAKEAGVTGLDELLNGPTAIAFVNGEPPETAKGSA